jgi:hypothetical protein
MLVIDLALPVEREIKLLAKKEIERQSQGIWQESATSRIKNPVGKRIKQDKRRVTRSLDLTHCCLNPPRPACQLK